MDIVLVQPPRYKRKASKRSQPPLGLAYIASFLLSKGLKVEIIDGLVSNHTIKSIVKEICKISPTAIGITTMSEDRCNAIELANRIKSRLEDILILGGGPHFSYSAVDALIHVPGLDAIVIGEGEITSWELLRDFIKNGDSHNFHNIDGCAFRDENGKAVITSPRTPIKNLDELPDPAWHLFDMDKYKCTLSVEEKTRAIGIISSRGCPYRCVFCANSLNRRVRYRSPKRFVDEVEFLHKKYGFPGLNFQDDSFTVNSKHIIQICEEILNREIKIRWYCSLRVNNVSKELLRLMKKAGCVALGYGIETGSDRLLKMIKKGITTKQIREAIKITKEVGFIHVGMFLMTSLPGQTLEDIHISNKCINEMHSLLYETSAPRIFIGGPTLIYPGTEIEMIARRNGNVFPKDFSWNTYYETDKAKIFNSNPYIPHFENPDLSLEEIKSYTRKLRFRYLYFRSPLQFLKLIPPIETLKDLKQLIVKPCRMHLTSLKLRLLNQQTPNISC